MSSDKFARLRWWLADRLRPNVWPSTAAQHALLLDDIKQWSRPLTDDEVDRLASTAFEADTQGGHHRGGPWTWHMIPEQGRENYRALVRAVLAEEEVIRDAP